MESLKLLMETNAEFSQDRRGFTALHHASIKGHDAALSALTANPSARAHIDTPDYQEGNTPLHSAVFKVQRIEVMLVI